VETSTSPSATAPESEVTVVVEIPRGGRAKFELDPDTGTIWLDRVLWTSTRYPAEYGFVAGTASGDGDPLDAVVLAEEATVPGCHIRARAIGVLQMSDEHGPDPKVLCVALGDPTLGALHDAGEVPQHLLDEIQHFFRVYKELEPRTSVEIGGWLGATEARALVAECRLQAMTTKEEPMHLDLDDDQVVMLRTLLDEAYRDLRYEIADTDNSVFKSQLRARETELAALLDKVGGPLPDR
jgi:inorganic pyrophosphatase